MTLVALVVGTAVLLGAGSYVFVERSLRDRLVSDAATQARFDLSVLIPSSVGVGADREAIEASGILTTLRSRGISPIVDFGDADPAIQAFRERTSPELRTTVARGDLGYEWTSLGNQPVLLVAGRVPPAGPVFYFVHDTTALETTLAQLRLGLGGGALLLVLIALLVAARIARGVLAPVAEAARAAERLEHGDLSARLAVGSREDEFGAWAERFNSMAAALEETVGRLQDAQAQNRRFVADVSHELRTPLTALVAEASILRDHLESLPPDARRAGELLVADIARLRSLVEELMELSRFDSASEQIAREPVDLGRLVRAIAASRLPEAELVVPDESIVVATDARRIDRILGNLLDNARAHAPGAPVQIRVRQREQEVVVTVLDAGPGVPEERLGRIFDRFFKADPSRGSGGSGLGLAIAAENAALLGGRLSVRNRERGGLRFDLRLPVTEPLRGSDPGVIEPREPRLSSPTAREPVR
jgi:two-component system sensor histidine kinase MtrB